MKVISKQLDAKFREAVEAIRTALGAANIGAFEFSVSASGRTMTEQSEVLIKYHLGDNNWSTRADVKGDNLANCTTELVRRVGWHKDHLPLALPGNRSTEDDC
jgi:hypothetical protein